MHEFPCPNPVTAVVRIGGGSVEISAEERDTATVDVTGYDDSNATQDLVQNTRVELVDGRLLVEAPNLSGWALRWRTPRLRVTIRVPLDCSLQIKVASADVNCHGRYAQASINTASGDVYLETATRAVTVNSASGDIRTGDIGGELRVRTASGDVTTRAVAGDITVQSASGDVEVERADASVHATTASGDVRVGAASRGTVGVNAASGDVSVGVFVGTRVWLDLSTMSGSTSSDLSVTDQATGGGEHSLSLQIRTISGDIQIRRVPVAADVPQD